MAPSLKDYPLSPGTVPLTLGLAGDHQKVNASLALQVCRSWLEQTGKWTGGEESRTSISCAVHRDRLCSIVFVVLLQAT